MELAATKLVGQLVLIALGIWVASAARSERRRKPISPWTGARGLCGAAEESPLGTRSTVRL